MLIFEGSIEDITDDSFHAHLISLRDDEEPDTVGEEFATEILLTAVSSRERPLVKLGAFFYWFLSDAGQVIVFQRNAPLTQQEIDAAHKNANEMMERLGWVPTSVLSSESRKEYL